MIISWPLNHIMMSFPFFIGMGQEFSPFFLLPNLLLGFIQLFLTVIDAQ